MRGVCCVLCGLDGEVGRRRETRVTQNTLTHTLLIYGFRNISDTYGGFERRIYAW